MSPFKYTFWRFGWAANPDKVIIGWRRIAGRLFWRCYV